MADTRPAAEETQVPPAESSAPPPTTASAAAAAEAPLLAAPQTEGRDDGYDDDADSALGDEAASSTASLTSSILAYRTIHGRTFHSDKFESTQYFTPNDSQQSESVDITHHYLTLMLDGKYHLTPLGDNVKKVVDIGTGTGIWAIDFADEYPNAEVLGTDLSPIQPAWVPPNVKFEIDDATNSWTWEENSVDFVHVRYLMGAIPDWYALFREAYRVSAPGGYIQSCEADVTIYSDDGTGDIPVIHTWNKLFSEGGTKSGRTFSVVGEDLQKKGLEAAGYNIIDVQNFKLPIGGWPANEKLAEVGRFCQMTLLNDIEGYTLFMWNNVMGWPKDEWQIFLMEMRKKVLRNRNCHSYMTIRYVVGQKPGGK